jgi:hypothetical protein
MVGSLFGLAGHFRFPALAEPRTGAAKSIICTSGLSCISQLALLHMAVAFVSLASYEQPDGGRSYDKSAARPLSQLEHKVMLLLARENVRFL